jgi:septal ring factor EnvC (AmiA/AmiB activator)
MKTDYESLNDTLEEQLRRELIKLNHECRKLTSENKLLRNEIRQLEEAKYKAFQRIGELTSEVKINRAS